ncbi:MAG: hypothetical protein H0U02_12060 [Rubrobacter sp.]|jgi:hypothetical protein|nr:hypothetical protein [Rubrobacter sp.]
MYRRNVAYPLDEALADSPVVLSVTELGDDLPGDERELLPSLAGPHLGHHEDRPSCARLRSHHPAAAQPCQHIE